MLFVVAFDVIVRFPYEGVYLVSGEVTAPAGPLPPIGPNRSFDIKSDVEWFDV